MQSLVLVLLDIMFLIGTEVGRVQTDESTRLTAPFAYHRTLGTQYLPQISQVGIGFSSNASYFKQKAVAAEDYTSNRHR